VMFMLQGDGECDTQVSKMGIWEKKEEVKLKRDKFGRRKKKKAISP
jgi:hypothetical protein